MFFEKLLVSLECPISNLEAENIMKSTKGLKWGVGTILTKGQLDPIDP